MRVGVGGGGEGGGGGGGGGWGGGGGGGRGEGRVGVGVGVGEMGKGNIGWVWGWKRDCGDWKQRDRGGEPVACGGCDEVWEWGYGDTSGKHGVRVGNMGVGIRKMET